MANATIEADDVSWEGPDAPGGAAGAAGAAWDHAPTDGGVMAGVFASFSEHGYGLGYRRAVSDMVALLLLAAAEHRREAGADTQARAAVSEFVDRLDRHLQRLSPAVLEEMSEGLGI